MHQTALGPLVQKCRSATVCRTICYFSETRLRRPASTSRPARPSRLRRLVPSGDDPFRFSKVPRHDATKPRRITRTCERGSGGMPPTRVPPGECTGSIAPPLRPILSRSSRNLAIAAAQQYPRSRRPLMTLRTGKLLNEAPGICAVATCVATGPELGVPSPSEPAATPTPVEAMLLADPVRASTARQAGKERSILKHVLDCLRDRFKESFAVACTLDVCAP
jgi:hypothetical protein